MNIKKSYYKFKEYIHIRILIKKYNKKVFLIGRPWHGNIGDQALVLAEKYILKKVLPEFKIIEMPSEVYNSKWTKFFGIEINKKEMIFLQGGGNLGTLYINEEIFHRDIVKKYPNNKIIIMPMSIFFHDNEFGKNELKKSAMIYNKHKDFTIISRDEISYNFAKKYFGKVNNILAPDSVTSLEDIVSLCNIRRKGICFFLRKDIEKVVTDDSINKIKDFLDKNKLNYILSDTADNNSYRTDDARKKSISSRWKYAQSSRLVITDRYHGVVFAVITHTPVIVFKSFDTKISSGVKWFEDLEWVHYVDSNDLNNIFKIIDKYCLHEEYKIKTTSKCKDIVIKKVKDVIWNGEGK